MTAFGGDFDSAAHATAESHRHHLVRPNLERRHLVRRHLVWCDVVGCDVVGCDLVGCDLVGCDVVGCDWSGATWSGATWSGASWSGDWSASWSGASWSGAELVMNATPRTSQRRLAAIVVAVALLALAPGLTASAAKGGNGRASNDHDHDDDVVESIDVVASETLTIDSVTTDGSTTESLTSESSHKKSSNAGNSLATVVAQIGADDMWAAGYTGEGVDVAVIDTGVAPVAELSTTDVFVGPDLSFEGGVDARRRARLPTATAPTWSGSSPVAPRAPTRSTRNRGDFVGVAPDAGIVSVKVADNTGAVDVSQVIAAIDWVVQNRNQGGLNIRVLNLAYNTDSTQHYIDDPLSKAVENAWNHGIVVVVSAGNEGRSAYGLANPATNPTVIAVSAAELFNGYGWGVPVWAPSGDTVRNPDLIAPGVSIASLRVPGSRIDVEHPGGRVTGDDRLFLGSGTSQAAAVTSGAAALLLEQRPELTPDQVKQLLIDNTAPVFEKVIFKGHGLLDLDAAMNATTPNTSPAFAPATGLGSLEAARGTDHITIGDTTLAGEYTVTGAAWDPVAWVEASESGSTWSGTDDWSGSTWSGSTWSGSTWSGSTWSGSTWSGSTWSGSTWSGSTWSGSTWSGSTWSGSTWSGSTWSGSTWSGSTWSGSTWSGSTWSGSTWS